MKAIFKILYIVIFLFVSASDILLSQSNITYDAGSLIDISSGADVCADAVIINGTYSGGGTICQGPLPVLISSITYSVNANAVHLNWITESELNNSGFDIERKGLNENTPWKKINFVRGNGTTTWQISYSFEDKKLSAGKYRYRLKQIDFNGNFEYFELENDVFVASPKSFSISQNYPNPSNPKSRIDYEIPFDGRVSIKIYDILGKEVFKLIDEYKTADFYSVEFDGSNLASGVYFYRIIAGGGGFFFTKTLKMILNK